MCLLFYGLINFRVYKLVAYDVGSSSLSRLAGGGLMM